MVSPIFKSFTADIHRRSIAQVGLYQEGVCLAVIGHVKVQIVAVSAASVPVVQINRVVAVRILTCGLYSQVP